MLREGFPRKWVIRRTPHRVSLKPIPPCRAVRGGWAYCRQRFLQNQSQLFFLLTMVYTRYILNIYEVNMENDTTLLLKLPKGLKMMIESCARDEDLTTSQLIRRLIRNYADKHYKGDLFAGEKK